MPTIPSNGDCRHSWTARWRSPIDSRCATGCIEVVIISFRHKGLRRFYESGSVEGIQPRHAKRLRLQLSALESAALIQDLDLPGWRLHPLLGNRRGRWSIRVSGSWRVTFEFDEGNVHVLDYEDYH
ncbi:type II toxin-antitoxin system RelE/ParE family toxin [Corynebacterium glyciniphilum]|uniref:type II toxin-antitoxin system RelE/ParE family toxin n=1 Tax=Corynebacterium glyciniphilum TaxID=1404244 RepID=UPI001D0E2CF8|nr:type II toxin-antitoxin system RelE/ParE family toxin [Corynebacterium glyciniphilum]